MFSIICRIKSWISRVFFVMKPFKAWKDTKNSFYVQHKKLIVDIGIYIRPVGSVSF